MASQLIQFAIVVTANNHNPSILNPDFLSAQNIVPVDWNWRVSEVIVTPPFARVAFSNGISITVESSKLQVTQAGETVEPEIAALTHIVGRYVQTLPHVQYEAVGINFESFSTIKEPGRYLKDRFMQQGAWDSEKHPLQAVGINFVYEIERGTLILGVDAGEAKQGDQTIEIGVVSKANFHRSSLKENTVEDIAQILAQAQPDLGLYQHTLEDILFK